MSQAKKSLLFNSFISATARKGGALDQKLNTSLHERKSRNKIVFHYWSINKNEHTFLYREDSMSRLLGVNCH